MTRTAVSLLLFLSFAAAEARADSVIFKVGTRLDCKVVGDTPEGLLVHLGENRKGSLVLDRATIERIEFDYDTRLAELRKKEAAGADTGVGHYELGLWCEEQVVRDRSMAERALACYLRARGKPGVSDECWLRIGRMFEKIPTPNPAEARNAYAEYLRLHPDSGEAAAAVKRLEESVRKAAPAAPVGGEGLEVKDWRAEKWCNDGSVRSVQDSGNGRTAVLELNFREKCGLDGKDRDKTAFTYTIQSDLAEKGAVLLDAFNPGKSDLRIALALMTGPNQEWFESEMRSLKPGAWTTGVRFDLTFSNWKCKKDNFQTFAFKPGDLNNVRNLVLLVYSGGTAGNLYIDNLRVE